MHSHSLSHSLSLSLSLLLACLLACLLARRLGTEGPRYPALSRYAIVRVLVVRLGRVSPITHPLRLAYRCLSPLLPPAWAITCELGPLFVRVSVALRALPGQLLGSEAALLLPKDNRAKLHRGTHTTPLRLQRQPPSSSDDYCCGLWLTCLSRSLSLVLLAGPGAQPC